VGFFDKKEDGIFNTALNNTKDSFTTSKAKVNDTVEKMQDVKIPSLNINDNIKSIAKNSLKTIIELDKELEEENCPYSIEDFTMTASLTSPRVEIKFRKKRIDVHNNPKNTPQTIKTPMKKLDNLFLGKCPSCNFDWQIKKELMSGNEKLSLRCSSCSDIFKIDINGKVLKAPNTYNGICPYCQCEWSVLENNFKFNENKQQAMKCKKCTKVFVFDELNKKIIKDNKQEPFLSKCPECNHTKKLNWKNIGDRKRAKLKCKQCQNSYIETF